MTCKAVTQFLPLGCTSCCQAVASEVLNMPSPRRMSSQRYATSGFAETKAVQGPLHQVPPAQILPAEDSAMLPCSMRTGVPSVEVKLHEAMELTEFHQRLYLQRSLSHHHNAPSEASLSTLMVAPVFCRYQFAFGIDAMLNHTTSFIVNVGYQLFHAR